MRSVLYHKSSPSGRVFTDQEEHDQALVDGWVEAPWLVDEVKEDAIEEREIAESNIAEHQGNDSGGTSAKPSRGSGTKQRREVKKPGRKKKEE